MQLNVAEIYYLSFFNH